MFGVGRQGGHVFLLVTVLCRFCGFFGERLVVFTRVTIDILCSLFALYGNGGRSTQGCGGRRGDHYYRSYLGATIFAEL